ncbi:hypothetical protein Taro_045188, partial [Colocasia esculenta]|nr:hypothetical protein [Colocasia esculenta]
MAGSVTPSVVTSSVGSPRFRVELQLDISSVAARLRGRPFLWGSFPTEPVISEAHLPYSFQVRESRRLPNRLLVPGHTVAKQGLRHLQQCNFLSCTPRGMPQIQDINMGQVIIERMKFAAEMIWDKKNKLNVSLPYAHLLTRIFKHYGIDLKGEAMEKMGQPILSRNLKKSGFSLVGSVWSKTSVEEGEAIISEAPEIPVVQEEETAVRVEEPVVVARRIEVIAFEHIEPIRQSSGVETPSTVIASVIEEALETVAHIEGEQEETHEEIIQNIPAGDSIGVKEFGAVKSELQEMKIELGSLKNLVTDLSEFVRVQLTTPAPPAPTQPVAEEPAVGPSGPVVEESGPSGPIDDEVIRPLGPSEEESGPPGPTVKESRPTGPSAGESGPSGPVESEVEQATVQEPVEEAAVPPEPPVPSPLQTPAPSTPPSSSTTPPAHETFKQPLPKYISSPTPFPTPSSSSPISSPIIPPPPTFEEPPTSSSVGPSSAGPSSVGPSAPPPPTSFYSLHPPTPPSFITIILENARIQGE